MSKPKLSRWFSGRTKPTLVGVYERNTKFGSYSYFDGKKWGLSSSTPSGAEKMRALSSVWQNIKWRGLAAAASNENGQRGSRAK